MGLPGHLFSPVPFFLNTSSHCSSLATSNPIIIMRFQLPALLILATAASAEWMISGYSGTGCNPDDDIDDWGDDNDNQNVCSNFQDDSVPILSAMINYTQGNAWIYSQYNCTTWNYVAMGSNVCYDYTDINLYATYVGGVQYNGFATDSSDN